jgi:hypothetical protein
LLLIVIDFSGTEGAGKIRDDVTTLRCAASDCASCFGPNYMLDDPAFRQR